MHFTYRSLIPIETAIIIFLAIIRALQGCPGFENYNVNQTNTSVKPKLEFDPVHLSKYIQNNTETNTLVVNKTGMQFQFNCWAPFPIDFNFSGHVSTGLGKDEVTARIFRRPFSLDKKDKRTCYGINVTLPAYEETTGNYSCFAVANISLMQSYYIFVSPSPPGVLLKRGQNVVLSLSPRATSVLLPCAVSNPDSRIKLIRNNREMKTQEDVLRYDPKLGFVVNLTQIQRPWGVYQCVSEQSSNDVVNITLLRKDFFVTPSLPNIRNSNNLSLTCQANEGVYFKFSPVEFPYIEHKENDPRYAFYYYTRFQSNDIKSGATGWIACVKNSTQEELYRWTFQISVTKPQGRILFDNIKSACEYKQNHTFCQECNNWIECNINKCQSKDKSCPQTKCSPKIPNAVIQCLNPNNQVSEVYFTGLNKTTQYTNWPKAPLEDILKVSQIIEPSTHSDALKFSCKGSSFVFASGFHWSYSLKDGISRDIPDFYKLHEVKHIWGNTQAVLKSLLDLKSLPKDATKIICSAPVWNSTVWKDVDVNVHHLHKKGNKKSSSVRIKASKGFGHIFSTVVATLLTSTLFYVSIN